MSKAAAPRQQSTAKPAGHLPPAGAPAPKPARQPPQPPPTKRPTSRRLRAFAFDPSLATELENFDVSEVIIEIPWEENLKIGPVGDYLEVIDYDPASGCGYHPVDLNHPHLLVQNGLAPSEGNPCFHQQMVYAVAMTTIQHFERAFGRKIFWSDQRIKNANGNRDEFLPVERLRIYPHALRENNAYYDSEKKALLFGYQPAQPEARGDMMPGGMVFTCLSHDIIAHETTHAILDGFNPRFLEPSNLDVLAFHEAFADIVALFQHFTYPEILRRQIARARGDLNTETLLSQLAVQLGKATGLRRSLRDAIGETDEATGKWRRREPDPLAFATRKEPHDRGAVLVAAVFDAFIAIYQNRTRDLLRIATGGTGILPQGDIHPDLVARLADEAANIARQMLLMCIRAIDYCPPVDITFGDYLRALITADFDMVPDDTRKYRVAIVESFRRSGIYPQDVRTLSVDSLCWQPPDEDAVKPFTYLLNRVLDDTTWTDERRRLPASPWEHDHFWQQKMDSSPWQELLAGSRATVDPVTNMPLRVPLSRTDLWARTRWLAARFHEDIKDKAYHDFRAGVLTDGRLGLMGLNAIGGHNDDCKFSVETVRPVRRMGPDGRERNDLLIQLAQRRPAFADDAKQCEETNRYRTLGPQYLPPPFKTCDFKFRGGTTFIIDLDNLRVRYAIQKDILSEARLNRERQFRAEMAGTTLAELYFKGDSAGQQLARLHGGEY